MFKKILITFVFCMSIFGITAFADEIDSNTYNLPESYKYYVTYSDVYGVRTLYSNDVIVVSGNNISATGSCMVYVGEYGDFSDLFNSVSNVNFSVQEVIKSGVIGVFPPSIPPTALEAIAKITPGLLAQLKILLPVGLIILSTLLGVSLIPRLVHLFL